MASRTQIVCLCEGKRGGTDPVFINKLMKSLQPGWLRPWPGSSAIRLVPCGGRTEVIKQTPEELRRCLREGGNTTLMVWADCDDDCPDPESLKRHFWEYTRQQSITQDQFDRVVFIFAKDRIENWIEFLMTGKTDESKEGPRVKHDSEAAKAAKTLAEFCKGRRTVDEMPPSLQWSCQNWRALVERMGAD